MHTSMKYMIIYYTGLPVYVGMKCACLLKLEFCNIGIQNRHHDVRNTANHANPDGRI